jgi:nucleotide-binding universal stress UspA family protein
MHSKRVFICNRKILVPVCLKEDSYASLALARSLAREPGVELVLLHVVLLNIIGEERGINRTGLVNDLCREADSQLKVLAEGIGEVVTTKVVHTTGRLAEAIVAAAKQMGTDTIVLVKRAHNGWLRWTRHNTASHVIRQAPCAVWLVTPHKRNARSNVIADHASPAAEHRNQIPYYENPNPFQAFFRVLFS